MTTMFCEQYMAIRTEFVRFKLFPINIEAYKSLLKRSGHSFPYPLGVGSGMFLLG